MEHNAFCDICEENFRTAKSFYNHTTNYHNEKCTINVLNKETKKKEGLTFYRNNGQFTCCKKTFVTTTSFKKHYKSNHIENNESVSEGKQINQAI
jgi:hypothetical protein